MRYASNLSCSTSSSASISPLFHDRNTARCLDCRVSLLPHGGPASGFFFFFFLTSPVFSENFRRTFFSETVFFRGTSNSPAVVLFGVMSSTVVSMNSERGEHTLVIDNFAVVKNKFEMGEKYITSAFTTCGEKWCIHCYFKGESEKNNSGSLYVRHIGKEKDFFVSYRISDDCGTKKTVVHYLGEKAGKNIGWTTVKGFENPPSDTYKARITIEVIRRVETFDFEEHTAPTLSEDLAALLSLPEKSADVEFVVEGRSFPGHRAILSARSPYFAAMLQNGMRESK